jgi:amidohydrolase
MTSIPLQSEISSRFDELVAMRRHLHQFPELSGEEYETTKYLVARLREAGLDVHVRPEGTGFYADLVPDGFDPERDKTIAVRADLDALAIQELNEVDYRSRRDGIMHACGHDVHMTIATGVGLSLAEFRKELPGRLRLVFQHAEETVPGGAIEMVEFGAMNDVDAVLGMHVDPELDVGKIGVRPGAFTAAFDVFHFTVRGESGHGARPHHTIDPIFVLTQLANALYNSTSRYYDARDPVVLSIGTIEAGRAPNVIPDEARMSGSMRTISDNHRRQVQPLLTRIADGIVGAHGAEYDLNLVKGAPAIFNDAEITNAISATATELFGADALYRIPLPSMGSEDFSYYLQEVPGAMFRLGVASDRPRYFLHSARFDIDEEAIRIGTNVLARTAVNLMRR